MEKKSFDTVALSYDDNPMHIERAERIADDIKNHLKIMESWNILDFGCGTGLLGFNFIKDVSHVDMMDTSDGMLNKVMEKIKANNIVNAGCICFDIEKDILPENKYDLIVTSMTFHHIEDLDMLLKKFFAMLKNGGYLAVSDLDEEDGSYHGGAAIPHHGINQEVLAELSYSNGFELIYKSIPYTIMKNLDGEERSFPVFLHIYRRN